MKKEIITCDLCGQEKLNSDMHTVCVVVRDGAQNSYLSGIGMFPLRSADLCKTCCDRSMADLIQAWKKEAEIARQEAYACAKRDAEDAADAALHREKERADRAEREKVEAEARAKAEQESAVLRAEQRAKEEADRKERERLAAEQAEKARQEKLAANKRHRTQVEQEAHDSLIRLHLNPDVAYEVLHAIQEGRIQHVTINY